jgi:hypothetical protein
LAEWLKWDSVGLSLHAGIETVLRQAWDSSTEQAERFSGKLASPLPITMPWGLGFDPRRLIMIDPLGGLIPGRSLGCTNTIESLDSRAAARLPWRGARMFGGRSLMNIRPAGIFRR